MLQSIMTSKGQITIPAKIRKKLNLHSGNKLEFVIKDDQVLMLPINRLMRELKGILPKPTNTITCEEMNNIIRDKGN